MRGTHALVTEPDEHPDQVVLRPENDNHRNLAHRHEAGAHRLRERVRPEQTGVEHDRGVAHKDDALADGQPGADRLAQKRGRRGEHGRHPGHVCRSVLVSALASTGGRALANKVRMGDVCVRDVGRPAPLLRVVLVVLIGGAVGVATRGGKVRGRDGGNDIRAFGRRATENPARRNGAVDVDRAQKVTVDPLAFVSESDGGAG